MRRVSLIICKARKHEKQAGTLVQFEWPETFDILNLLIFSSLYIVSDEALSSLCWAVRLVASSWRWGGDPIISDFQLTKVKQAKIRTIITQSLCPVSSHCLFCADFSDIMKPITTNLGSLSLFT